MSQSVTLATKGQDPTFALPRDSYATVYNSNMSVLNHIKVAGPQLLWYYQLSNESGKTKQNFCF